ncbi:hypothetical protein B9479_007442 [Cryptococcus floricola]|uniref:Mss4-like protein n=1 Tax=Cryptococcus floricola TaxID=2591691 RepID=A0A5D3APF6_9TREE|nr:hypothetical protein B9479_007442 [Cryptococcus floricola]
MTAPYSQADILAALSAQSALPRTTPTYPFSSFPTPLLQLTNAVPEDKPESPKTNGRKVYCPREGCGSVIMQAGVGNWLDIPGAVLPDDPKSPFPHAQPPHAAWHVPNGPFEFDNIGFSRPDASASPLPAHAPGYSAEKKVKWLICGECDLGPLGWSYEGGKDAWLGVERVRYGEGKKPLE